MASGIPPRVWLLIVTATLAAAPARYVVRHFQHAPSRRDITLPPEDLGWRTTRQLHRSLAMLAGLAAFALFIFTPQAAQFASADAFVPLLMAVFAAFLLFTVVKGLRTGRILPMIRGAASVYDRRTQPKRFWLAAGWNGFLGAAMLSFALLFVRNLDEDRCTETSDKRSATVELAACNRLLARARIDRADRMNWVSSRAWANHRLGNDRQAITDYEAAIALDPSNSANHYDLGLIHDQLGDRVAALADYSAAIDARSDNDEAYLQRGMIYLDSGRLDQALTDFTRAHELKPDDVWPLANRGMTHVWRRERDEAERDFALVRAKDPHNDVMLRGEGLVGMMDGDWHKAVTDFSAALAADPDNRFALRMRAQAYDKLGQSDRGDDDRDRLWRLTRRAGPSA